MTKITQNHMVIAIVAIGIVCAVLVFTVLPGSEINVLRLKGLWHWLGEAFLWILGAVLVYVLPGLVGAVISFIVFVFDDLIEERRPLGMSAHLLISLIFAVVYSQLHALIVQKVLTSAWAHGIHDFVWYFMSETGYKLDHIVFETPPIPWMVYGALAFLAGYSIADLNWPRRSNTF